MFRSSVVALSLAILAAGCGGGGSQPAPSGSRASGVITLSVDARDIPIKVYHAHERIPVVPGPLTLVYPKWLPGEHGPTGPITDLVGLKFTADGQAVTWRRDPADMYAFHLIVPAAATTLDVDLDFLSATSTSGFTSAASATPNLAVVTWNQLLVYPAGAKTDDVKVQVTLRLPAEWKFASALKTAEGEDSKLTFEPVSLTTLVDSPLLTGRYMKTVPLDDASDRKVVLDMAADSDAALAIGPELTAKLKRLVTEADAMFGARHFNDYHFLLSLSDHVAHFGLEHHQSNDSRVGEHAIVEQAASLGVLAHEYVHSWNGKYRRPVGLATPDFQQPMDGELLWVYEGLTQYLGYVLAARSGLWSDGYYKERLAQVAAYLDHLPGRRWRPLLDTTLAAQLLYNAPAEWAAYRRSTDFYDEGWLVWLDVDTQIRQLSGGQRSIDDFCHRFHGGQNSPPQLRTYTFDEVVTTLNAVASFDWKTFLEARVGKAGEKAPLEGLARSGWRLTFNESRNEYLKLLEEGEQKRTEVGYSIGLRLSDTGKVIDGLPGSPALDAGVGPGMTVLEVNGQKYSANALRAAIQAAAKGKALTLKVLNSPVTSTVNVKYPGGLREPHLERVESAPDVLKEILKPKSAK